VSSVYVQLADDLPGAADRSTHVAVYRLADSLYLRVIPQGHRDVNSDNTGPNDIGPKNVNAQGEFREILFVEIIGLGPSRIPAFSELSCVATVRTRGR
jgi:hypothetical protein